jgi:hypothetical protein
MPREYLVPILVSNLVAAVFVAACYRRPAAARWVFAAGFIAAGLFNAYTALHTPAIYVTAYGPLAIGPYRAFIEGWFARHTAAFVLCVAAGQLTTGVLGFVPGWPRRLSLLGGIVFLAAITPLGWGSAFPATLILIGGLLVLFRKAFRRS